MRNDQSNGHPQTPLTYPTMLVVLVFVVIALAFLWQEHQGHILSALPYLFVLLCPLMHVVMHGHHHHGLRPQPRTNERPEVQEHEGEQS